MYVENIRSCFHSHTYKLLTNNKEEKKDGKLQCWAVLWQGEQEPCVLCSPFFKGTQGWFGSVDCGRTEGGRKCQYFRKGRHLCHQDNVWRRIHGRILGNSLQKIYVWIQARVHRSYYGRKVLCADFLSGVYQALCA